MITQPTSESCSCAYDTGLPLPGLVLLNLLRAEPLHLGAEVLRGSPFYDLVRTSDIVVRHFCSIGTLINILECYESLNLIC